MGETGEIKKGHALDVRTQPSLFFSEFLNEVQLSHFKTLRSPLRQCQSTHVFV